MPSKLSPQLATLVSEPPVKGEWIYELKLDGYRGLTFTDGKNTRIVSRNDKEWTAGLPTLVAALQKLPAEQLIADGEVVAFTEDGRTSFQALQNAFGSDQLYYYLFDLLYLDGHDLRECSQIDRKLLLESLCKGLPKQGRVRYSQHVEGPGRRIFEDACRLGAEGVIAKAKLAPYQSRRTRDWLKIKCLNEQEFVVGGWTDPTGSRTGIGALLLGVYDPDGVFTYAGKVGTGFTRKTLAELSARLKPLEQKRSPFERGPRIPKLKATHFLRPEVVVEVSFTEWTGDGQLRHPSFKGVREDRDPKEVVRERPST